MNENKKEEKKKQQQLCTYFFQISTYVYGRDGMYIHNDTCIQMI